MKREDAKKLLPIIKAFFDECVKKGSHTPYEFLKITEILD